MAPGLLSRASSFSIPALSRPPGPRRLRARPHGAAVAGGRRRLRKARVLRGSRLCSAPGSARAGQRSPCGAAGAQPSPRGRGRAGAGAGGDPGAALAPELPGTPPEGEGAERPRGCRGRPREPPGPPGSICPGRERRPGGAALLCPGTVGSAACSSRLPLPAPLPPSGRAPLHCLPAACMEATPALCSPFRLHWLIFPTSSTPWPGACPVCPPQLRPSPPSCPNPTWSFFQVFSHDQYVFRLQTILYQCLHLGFLPSDLFKRKCCLRRNNFCRTPIPCVMCVLPFLHPIIFASVSQPSHSTASVETSIIFFPLNWRTLQKTYWFYLV